MSDCTHKVPPTFSLPSLIQFQLCGTNPYVQMSIIVYLANCVLRRWELFSDIHRTLVPPGALVWGDPHSAAASNCWVVSSFYEFRRQTLHAEHVYSTVCPSATNLYVGFSLSSAKKVHILYSCPATSASLYQPRQTDRQTAVPLAPLKHKTGYLPTLTHLGEIRHASSRNGVGQLYSCAVEAILHVRA